VAQEQQQVADAFYAQKLIPNKLTIQDAKPIREMEVLSTSNSSAVGFSSNLAASS
jgi:hypothetical protein